MDSHISDKDTCSVCVVFFLDLQLHFFYKEHLHEKQKNRRVQIRTMICERFRDEV